MKKNITLIALFISAFSYAQKSEVIEDSTQTKAALFSKSVLWVTTTWKSANRVIDLKDEDGGIIVVKGGLSSVPRSLGLPGGGSTSTQLTIRVKDKKAKIEFQDTFFKWDIGTVWTADKPDASGQRKKWQETVLKEIDDLILSYKKSLSQTNDF